ncbi:Kinesin-related motor protein [Savitreella phatthalungensis]
MSSTGTGAGARKLVRPASAMASHSRVPSTSATTSSSSRPASRTATGRSSPTLESIPASRRAPPSGASTDRKVSGSVPYTSRPQSERTASTASTHSMNPPAASVPSNTTSHNVGMRAEQLSREVAAPPGETNIQVVVRCRDRNERERQENSSVIISTQVEGGQGKAISVQTSPLSTLSNKIYNFDRVYGAESTQSMLFDETVVPIVDEMLGGYNCTIFAYGQTGTGKTYTMSGDMSDYYGRVTEQAGIIPRTLYRVFKELDREDDAEYSVKCSFIELYNEELRDLLSTEGDDKKCKIFDDTSKKGGVIINGMEEVAVKDAAHGVKILQEGSRRREVAATKCNELSSRSHSVFTITVHIKQATDGEDMLRVGKLNLVDLAGSENIGRSGAENKRAREAGMINQSLLTLGRVINALVDRSQHIPYRESKLTRLLQDSLGGRTKTCIVATISPAKVNMDETVSTLDYAIRAKSIKNKPQLNQMMTKKALIRDYVVEIERLKADLVSTRQKNGVYMTEESHAELVAANESNKLLTEEQGRKIEALNSQLVSAKDQFESTMNEYIECKRALAGTEKTLSETSDRLQQTDAQLAETSSKLADETLLRHAHQKTEGELDTVANSLKRTLDQTLSHVGGLHDKVDRKRVAQESDVRRWQTRAATLAEVADVLARTAATQTQKQQEGITKLTTQLSSFVDAELARVRACHDAVESQLQAFVDRKTSHESGLREAKSELDVLLDEIAIVRGQVRDRLGEGLTGLDKAAGRIAEEVTASLGDLQTTVHESYSQLGHDFKAIFDATQRHLAQLAEEIAGLRTHIASKAQLDADEANHIAVSLQEQQEADEREQRSAEEDFLAQVQRLAGDLVNSRRKRDAMRLNLVTESCAALTQRLTHDAGETDTRLASWATEDDTFGRRLAQGKEELKRLVVASARSANTKTAEMRDVAANIHAETTRLVAEAVGNVDSQTSALEGFVSRAKLLTSTQFERHIADLSHMQDAEAASALHLQGQFADTARVLTECGTFVATSADSLSTSALAQNTAAADAATTLVNAIQEPVVQPDAPTGHTPKKQEWRYVSSWAVTAPHATILARDASIHTTPPAEDAEMSDHPATTPIDNRTALSDVDPNTAAVVPDEDLAHTKQRSNLLPPKSAISRLPSSSAPPEKSAAVASLAVGQENGRPLKTRKRVL